MLFVKFIQYSQITLKKLFLTALVEILKAIYLLHFIFGSCFLSLSHSSFIPSRGGYLVQKNGSVILVKPLEDSHDILEDEVEGYNLGGRSVAS